MSRYGHEQPHHNSAGRSGHATERQPHLFGAAPFQYRAGSDIADMNKPPSWEPELAHNKDYAYTLEEWIRDLRRWLAATKLHTARQGPLISLSVGGAARMVLDELDEETLIHGTVADFGDGQGRQAHSGVECIIRVLRLKFPENSEARMLKAGLEFFSFCPRPGEIWEVLILRFNTMLQKADQLAELQISWPFKSWMLLTLLRLPARKWTELLKDMDHHFPRTEEQYQELQQMILREKALEAQIQGNPTDNTQASNAFMVFATHMSTHRSFVLQSHGLKLCAVHAGDHGDIGLLTAHEA